MKKLAIFTILMFLTMSSIAFAHSYKQGDIEIGHIWTRATAPGMTTAAVYMPLLNTGTKTDELVGASSDWADKIEIHESTNENNIARMKMLDSLALEPNKPVAMRPGGIHLMVIGLKHQLKKGDMFPLTLQFKNAGSIKVEAMIEAMGATSGGD